MEAMTTLKITVNNRSNAQLLTKLLKSMTFVKKIEEEIPNNQTNQYIQLNKILNSIEPGNMFPAIDDPIEYQKNIRNEWETH